MDLIITILPVVTKDLPIFPRFTPYDFLSRCKFSTLTTRQPMIDFYLLTFPRFPLRKKEHKSYFGKNRTHDFRTNRCAGYLLDHSGDEGNTGRLRACSFLGAWRALICGEFFYSLLGAGWCPIWSVFGRRMTSEYHFPERGTSNSYVVRSIAVSP